MYHAESWLRNCLCLNGLGMGLRSVAGGGWREISWLWDAFAYGPVPICRKRGTGCCSGQRPAFHFEEVRAAACGRLALELAHCWSISDVRDVSWASLVPELCGSGPVGIGRWLRILGHNADALMLILPKMYCLLRWSCL